MQPFGLMNFLKFALQASEQNQTPSTTAQAEGKNPSQGDFSPPFDSESVTNSQESTPSDHTPIPSPNEEAYWSFVEKHNRTSQKIKHKNR